MMCCTLQVIVHCARMQLLVLWALKGFKGTRAAAPKHSSSYSDSTELVFTIDDGGNIRIRLFLFVKHMRSVLFMMN